MEIRTADFFTQEPPSPRTFGSCPSSSRTYMCVPVDRFVRHEWLREFRGLLPSPAPQALLLESTPGNVHWDLDAVKIGPCLIEASSHPLPQFRRGLACTASRVSPLEPIRDRTIRLCPRARSHAVHMRRPSELVVQKGHRVIAAVVRKDEHDAPRHAAGGLSGRWSGHCFRGAKVHGCTEPLS